jgi:hypothetical protein
MNFDNIMYAFLMIFQCVTMEGWSEIMISLIKAFNFLSIVYFVLLVFIGSFFLLNLTLAVIKAKFTESLGKKEEVKKMIGGIEEEHFDINIFKIVKRFQRSQNVSPMRGKSRSAGVGRDFTPADGRLQFVLFENDLKQKLKKKRASVRRSRRMTLMRGSKRGSIRYDNAAPFNFMANKESSGTTP